MAQRSHVPKFGNWESEENVPYTAFFDKARKDRTGGKIVNPNDPQESPDLHQDYVAPTRAPPTSRAKPEVDEPVVPGPARRAHERGRSRDEGEFRQYADSPARHDNVNRRPSGDSTPSRYGRGVSYGEAPKRPTRPSAGSEYSLEKSPLHHQARAAGRGTMASPAWEGKNSYDSSHGTPARSRMRPSKGDESPDKGAAVPKFGDWDENNPASADGYTHIFNKVREERNNGGKAPGMPGEQSPYNSVRNRKAANSSSAKSCCLPWCRK